MKRIIISFAIVSCLVLLIFLSSGVDAGVERQQDLSQEKSQNQVGTNDPATLSLDSIPEPATIAIIGTGVLALTLRKRRRKMES